MTFPDITVDLKSRMPNLRGRLLANQPLAELTPDLYSATSKTFVGQVYTALGLRNIADAADSAGFGYPQLSAEYAPDP